MSCPVLATAEAWLASLPEVDGIPVARALTYELVQLLNRAILGGYGNNK